jgi:hypothetical protein
MASFDDAYQQGNLDRLCGLYAAVNATRLILPGLGSGGARTLFDHLTSVLFDRIGRDGMPEIRHVLETGMSVEIMEATLQATAAWAGRNGAPLKLTRMFDGRRPSLQQFIDETREAMAVRASALIVPVREADDNDAPPPPPRPGSITGPFRPATAQGLYGRDGDSDEHWTCIRGFSANRVLLTDSRSLPVNPKHFNISTLGTRKGDPGRHRIMASRSFLLARG